MNPIEFCDKYRACNEGKEFALQFDTMAEVWENCKHPDWLFWILEKHKPLEKEQSVRLAIAFAESVLHYVTEGETRAKLAIEAAKAWLANPCEETKLAAAAASRCAAADGDAPNACYAAAAAARYAAANAANTDARYAAAARYAANTASRYADDARYADAENQCKIIREAITNPFV